MKPVNNIDLRRSYINFILYFITVVAFTILLVFFFFLTANHEVVLLNERVKQSDKLVAARNDINNNFDIILQRMQQLSQFTKMSSAELNNQSLLLNDIQEANLKIQSRVQESNTHLKSFELYKKLTDDITIVAGIKDSLQTTRFQIESLRSQLSSCNRTNSTVVNKIKGRFGR